MVKRMEDEIYYDVIIVEKVYNLKRNCCEYYTYCAFRKIEEKFLLQLLAGLKALITKMSIPSGKVYEIFIS